MARTTRDELARQFKGGNPEAWVAALEDADLSDIAHVLASKAAGGYTGAELEAYRSAAHIIVESRLTAKLVAELDQVQQATDRMRQELASHVKAMDRSTTRLGQVGLGLTIVGLLLATAQVYDTLAPQRTWSGILAVLAAALLVVLGVKRLGID